MPEFLLSGARLVDPASGRDEDADVRIADGMIAEVGAVGSLGGGLGDTLDCSGLVLAPGFVDMHTHLREPGGEVTETIESGTRAAALGGYTAVAAMANTDPVADSAAVIAEVEALADKAGWCEVFPVGAITRGLAGEQLVDMAEMAEMGVRMFSDDGHCVPEGRTMRMAMEYARIFDVVLAEHCEDVSLSEGWTMHEGPTSARLGLAGMPSEAEEVIVARDLMLARLTGARLHLCHLSTAGSVELVRRAKAEGLRVTAEVTPHHLALIDEDVDGYDTNRKMNPPLRTAEDRAAVATALADGTIDVVATDHAPHAEEAKEREFDHAPNGTIGLETALGVVLTELVEPGICDLPRAVESMSTAPARILGAADQGGPVEPGRTANLVVFDPAAEWTVSAPFASRSANSAFLGKTLRGRVVHTFFRGEPVVRDGQARP